MKRRNFLRNLGFTGGIFALPTVMSETSAAIFERENELVVKGKVMSEGKGIANVAVTDGTQVFKTNQKGEYQFTVKENADFVYISSPAGYAFDHDNFIASFYVSVKGKRGTLNHDFILTKLTTNDSQHNFVVWADTQMISASDCEQLKTTTVPDFKKLIQQYPANTLFHGIGCGDLVWDKFEFFKDYKEAIAMTGVPFYNVIGNHDMDLNSRTDDYSAETFKAQFGPTYYSFNRGAIHYVVLDDVFFIGTAKKYIGYLTENQLAWLEKDLQMVAPGTTVVVSLHIPTFTGAPKRNKKEEDFGGTVSNRKKLYSLLAPYKVHILSGHTHFNETWEEGNIMEHNHGTVCGAWWTGPICGDGTPRGYGVYEVNGNDIKWYYKSTEKDINHQLRIYPKGYAKAYPEEIAVNIWNWDAKWKVEWFEDGLSKGAPEQRVAKDPWAIELYDGPSLPQKHKFIEPTLTEHLFFIKPSANAKSIKVKATDRFGKIFEEAIMIN